MKATASTTERYLAFMQSIQNRKRGFRSITKLISKNRLGMALGTVLNQEELIKRGDNGIYTWSGPKPTIEMASMLAKSVNDSIKKYAPIEKESNKKINAIQSKKVSHSSDILDLSKLRKEKSQLLSRVEKIDAVLKVAAEMQ